MKPMRTAVFFDLDKTLIQGDSQTMELFHILHHEKPPFFFYLKLAGPFITGALSRIRVVSQEYHNLSYLETYRGQHAKTLAERGEVLFQQTIRLKFYEKALFLMKEHRRKGHLVMLVSATPVHILAPVAAHLKPDDSACTHLGFDDRGFCTGKPRDSLCIGKAKAEQVRRMAAVHGLDLASCFAYSDHHADLPFLESVGYPAAVNPTNRLLRIARKRNWKVYRFF